MLRQQPLSDLAAIWCTHARCKDSAGFHLVHQAYSGIHLFFTSIEVAILDTDVLLRHRMAGGGGRRDFRAFIMRWGIEPRPFRSNTPVIARWWSTKFEREAGLEVMASASGARECECSV